MKRFSNTFFIAVCLFVVNSAMAQLAFKEDFTGASGTVLTSAGWTLSGTSNVNPLTIVQSGLTFIGYPGSGVGNSVAMTNNGQDVYKTFSPINQGSVYLSFMVKIDSVKTGDYFIALSASTSQTNYFARLHAQSSGAGFLLGISKNNELSGGSKYGTTVLNLKTTYVVVVKYTFVASDSMNDAISVYAFSSTLPSTEPVTAEIASYTNSTKTDAADIGMVTLRQGTSTAAPTLTIDGIQISKTWSGIVTGVTHEKAQLIPTSLELSQNYPNPFNPTTNIEFQIPTNGFVSLKVFDILGNEVATLVNQEQTAGSYSVNFDASKLSSGMYVYRLQSAKYSEIKKMMLLK